MKGYQHICKAIMKKLYLLFLLMICMSSAAFSQTASIWRCWLSRM